MGRRLFFSAMLAAGLSICILEILMTGLSMHGLSAGIFPLRFSSGAAQNTNAFGVQLCVLLAILLGYPAGQTARRGWREMAFVLALAIVMANLYLAHSRTGYVAGLAVLVGGLFLVPLRARALALACPLAAGVIIVVTTPITLVDGTFAIGSGNAGLASLRVVDAGSDTERMQTIWRGLELWRAHPLFGSGLGAFAEEVRQSTGRLFVIHNTTVWMFAELGLLGVGAMLALFWGVTASTWAHARAPQPDPAARTLLLVLIAAALFQLPHDVFYQRIFWLVMGVTLFAGTFSSEVRTPRTFSLPPRATLRPMLTSTRQSVDIALSHAREEPQWRASRSG